MRSDDFSVKTRISRLGIQQKGKNGIVVTEKSFLVLFGRKEKCRQKLNSYLPQQYPIKLCVLNTLSCQPYYLAVKWSEPKWIFLNSKFNIKYNRNRTTLGSFFFLEVLAGNMYIQILSSMCLKLWPTVFFFQPFFLRNKVNYTVVSDFTEYVTEVISSFLWDRTSLWECEHSRVLT